MEPFLILAYSHTTLMSTFLRMQEEETTWRRRRSVNINCLLEHFQARNSFRMWDWVFFFLLFHSLSFVKLAELMSCAWLDKAGTPVLNAPFMFHSDNLDPSRSSFRMLSTPSHGVHSSSFNNSVSASRRPPSTSPLYVLAASSSEPIVERHLQPLKHRNMRRTVQESS